MRIGIPKEPYDAQTLVSASPDTVGKLVKLGYEVCVESGAGEPASYYDDQYAAAGASVVGRAEAWGADIVTFFDTPTDAELSLVRRGATLLGRMNPNMNEDDVEKFQKMGVTAIALDMVPRVSRAQALDVRSSLMNVAGYRAVIEAAAAFGRTFAGQVTAAGKVKPASVYVIGVGVAGLAAVGQAGSMGAQVFATDVRAEVADQVESLGGTFVEIPVKQESLDGYARALTEKEQALVLKTYAEQAAKSDVVITTAQVPGRPAPLLITEEAVAGMKPGSVIVDMGASAFGGNCSLSKPGEVVVTSNGVTIIGYNDLPRRLPSQSSQLFGQNIVNLMKLVTKGGDGVPVWDMDDEVVRGMTVTLEGRIMWPPPPVKVSSASAVNSVEEEKTQDGEGSKRSGSFWWKALIAALAIVLVVAVPASIASHFMVFMLACVVGFYVITGVSHSLHTPLMSVTNAISGIIVVAALLQMGSDDPVVTVLASVAVAIASINVFGGFAVTCRMLKMFERSND